MKLKSLFWFNKQQRRGVFYLGVLIVFVFLGIWWSPTPNPISNLQVPLHLQATIDSLRKEKEGIALKSLKPFSVNGLTDYRAYVLGLSTKTVDNYNAYRKDKNWIRTKEEFLIATKMDDTTYARIAPWLQYPKTTFKKKAIASRKSLEIKSSKENLGLNKVRAADLLKVSGIGAVLSKRIVKFREKLGGFVVQEQLYDVYGLDVEVANKVLKSYPLLQAAVVNKISLNECSLEELASLVYINKYLATEIILFRENNNGFQSLEELKGVRKFPVDKFDRIKLYLSLE